MDYSNMNKEFVLRNMRNIVDSPVPPVQHNQEPQGLSPMSGLALDLCGASLSVASPRRRLSLSSVNTGTPSPLNLHRKLLRDLNNSATGSDISMTESPLVFKQSARISTTMTSPSRPRSVLGAINKENSGGTSSPHKVNTKVSPLRRHRTPLEDHSDPNSQDSGLELSADPATFRFAEPLNVAPRKTTPRKESRKEMAPQCLSPVSPRAAARGGGTALFHCLSSGSESIDDGFLEFLSMDKEDDDANFPTGMGSLLSGKIMRDSPAKSKSGSGSKHSAKRSLHRSLSMADCDTPVTTKARSCLFKSPSAEYMAMSPVSLTVGGFKRPEPPTPIEHLASPHLPSKRRKSCNTSPTAMITLRSLSENTVSSVPRGTLTQSSLLNYGFQRKPAMTKFQRSYSESEATIKNALQRSLTEPDLIGDFSRPYVLPLMEGRHADLKTIAPDTLANLMNGHFDEYVNTFAIVDCRYPYEFSGGHIRGSRNLYTKDLVNDELVNNSQPPRHKNQRHVLVFHCEFSSERAPSMSRYLRNVDRDVNKECYPQLHYPEMYLLHGGYKAFYEQFSELCDPCGYVPMLSQGNEADLRHFRAKSRSWAGDIKNTASRLPPKFSLKRLDV